MNALDPRALHAALRLRAAAFEEAGLVEDADLRIVVELALLGPEARPDVLLALALVLAAPRRGDVALDLTRAPLPPESDAPSGAAWLELVRTSPLVAPPAGAPRTPFVVHGRFLYARRSFEQQVRLADALRARAEVRAAGLAGMEVAPVALAPKLRRLFPDVEGAPPDKQLLAVATGALRRVTVIAGGPGTGKTYTIRALLAVLLELAAERGVGLRVALSAPTGKAAARITQAIGEGLEALDVEPQTRAALASLEARTVHRLLATRRSSALPHDVVVVDEASMVDLTLMSRLVAALRPEARLVLLGDPHQLASVEAGAVLADLLPPPALRGRVSPAFAGALEAALAAANPSGEDVPPLAECVVGLERPHRFDAGGPIGRLALAIGEGTAEGIDRALAVFDEPVPKDGAGASIVAHGRALELGDATIARLASGYRAYLDVLDAGPRPGESPEAHHARVLSAFDAYRVLCAHRTGAFGAETIAHALGARLLRERRSREGVESAWLGKPVLILRNSYDVELFNGDVGIVVRRDGEPSVVFAAGPTGVRYLRPERLPPHELALATTVHKAQGSQVDHVALVLPDAPTAVLTREVVYTAITRARRSVTIAGDRALLRAALDRPTVRASGLAGMLWGAATTEGPAR